MLQLSSTLNKNFNLQLLIAFAKQNQSQNIYYLDKDEPINRQYEF